MNSSDSDNFDLSDFVPRMIEIPDVFHSLEHDGPFEKCIVCHYPLAASDYMVERIFRGSEPIVEYAICDPCQHEMSVEMSSASRQAVLQLFESVDHEARAFGLKAHLDTGEVAPWLETCLLTGKHRDDCRGYQIISRCHGFELQLGILPVMISDEGAKQIAAVLSQQTRGFMDDFMDRFGMPPEFSADPDWAPIFL